MMSAIISLLLSLSNPNPSLSADLPAQVLLTDAAAITNQDCSPADAMTATDHRYSDNWSAISPIVATLVLIALVTGYLTLFIHIFVLPRG